jgi:hypothetical protein
MALWPRVGLAVAEDEAIVLDVIDRLDDAVELML